MFRSSRKAFVLTAAVVTFAMTLAASGNFFLLLQPVDRTSPGLMAWWTVLCVVSLGNIWLWCLSAQTLANRRESSDAAQFAYQRWHLLLCAGYVLGLRLKHVGLGKRDLRVRFIEFGYGLRMF
jgi:hypothetical protein